MPELPEVENVRTTLKKLVIGKKIINVIANVPRMIVGTTSEEFTQKLVGQTFEDVRRRGKFLIFDLTNVTLLSHLRMEGKFQLSQSGEEIGKHIHFIFQLADQTELRYHDVRKFGTIEITKKHAEEETKSLKKLGPEPFSNHFNQTAFSGRLKSTNRPVKVALLDQSFVAGVGNIYADEICFQAKIDPSKPGKQLNHEEISRLYKAIKSILASAIRFGGSTIRTYTNSQGEIGTYQEKLLVYGKKGLPCFHCGEAIQKIKLGGRGTHFCPNCQK